MRLRLLLVGCAAFALSAAVGSQAQSPPAAKDPIEALQEKLARGDLRLDHGADAWGYLPAVLRALDIPVDSQLLVFSKTSLQFTHISPATPRAIYFNDDTMVASVQGGELIEITTTGSDGRVAFYTLETAPSATPKIHREGPVCLGCHSAADPGAPGLLVTNVMPLEDGSPLFIDATRLFHTTDATTPFEDRWGGWYVTGQHGKMRHNGNVLLSDQSELGTLRPGGLNVMDLSTRFDTRPYLAPTSDIVALMTFEHQIGIANRIWRLHAQTRSAAADAPGADETVEELVAYMLGVGEAPLPSPVSGPSGFTASFAARGPRDARGRSLRDFDLQTRLFRYPVSYMVYSRTFDGLPPALRQRIYHRMFEVLSGADRSGKFAHITPEAGRAALEILRDTKPDLPAEWRAAAPAITASAGAG